MYGRPLSNTDLAATLCAGSPSLRELLRCHVANYGTLIPHVFMGDVLACAGRCAASEAGGDRAELRHILDTLENGISHGDRETRNAIAISFAADAQLETFFAYLKPLMGPRMRAAFATG
ncbi:MAG TPA: hypothetical protein VFP44_22670 [Usitatibacter sp.]|nr:hypothetical protein [Usitatibacter sp.]